MYNSAALSGLVGVTPITHGATTYATVNLMVRDKVKLNMIDNTSTNGEVLNVSVHEYHVFLIRLDDPDTFGLSSW